MIAISFVSVTLLLILAGIATYLSIKNLMRWKEIETDVAKARVFLDKSFLNANFNLTLALVGLLLFHFILMEYHELTGTVFQGFNLLAYYGVFIASIAALVLLVHIWYKLLHKSLK